MQSNIRVTATVLSAVGELQVTHWFMRQKTGAFGWQPVDARTENWLINRFAIFRTRR